MTKLTTKQIAKIIDLRNSGKKQSEIAKQIGVSQITVCYWLSSQDKRKEISKKVYEGFKNKSKEEKKVIYKKRLPYIREYIKNKYRTNEDFRIKVLSQRRKKYSEDEAYRELAKERVKEWRKKRSKPIEVIERR